MQLFWDKDLSIKFAEDKEKEVDELCLQLSMAVYSLYQAKNQSSMAATHKEVDLSPRAKEIKPMIEGTHALGESEGGHGIFTFPYPSGHGDNEGERGIFTIRANKMSTT